MLSLKSFGLFQQSFSVLMHNCPPDPKCYKMYCNCSICSIFTARRYAKCGICRRRVSVRLSVCVSVPFRYCIKTAERSITQIMPHDGVFKLDVL